MQKLFIISALVIVLVSSASARQTPEGSLKASSKSGTELGTCPLKHTKVRTDISGFLARVTVEQEFENTFNEAIEAIYVFPLSANGAVDSMTMTIGQRTIRGVMMKREEARKAYEAAKKEGRTASLLDQERPNVFTQSVANIQPGDKIIVEISYVETLKYDDGTYEFVFPMTVAPRYSPQSTADANKPKPAFAISRHGHDISIEVNLNAGVPVGSIASTSHEIDTLLLGANGGKITLRDQTTIPNKDFVLRYDIAGAKIEDALLTHNGPNGGFFSLILQPPETYRLEDVTPKEIVFVLDSSGSMSGFPIEKAKEAIRLSLDGLYPHDTFNVIKFAGETDVLFPEPMPATRYNLDLALEYLERNGAGGGTEMMKAIDAALKPSETSDHVRIVCFMTDGLVDNEREIIAAVKKYNHARVFSFGIGNSVNRFLLDRIAEAGRGEATYISRQDDGSAAARKFYERVRTPILTDISIDWNGLPVTQVYPSRIGDLFSAKPVVVNGRYTGAASGMITLRGKSNGQEFERTIEAKLPDSEPSNNVLATLWARTRIDDLWSSGMKFDRGWVQELTPEARNEITAIGLKYSIMTEFTSFVAVDERVRGDGRSKRSLVPNGIPDTGYGEFDAVSVSRVGLGSGQGNGTGRTPGLSSVPSLASGGVINGKAVELIQPNYPAAAMAVRASGLVAVQIIVDEKGKVISASAISGHPLLRAAAVRAAMASKFAVTLLGGMPVKTSGVINYNFMADQVRTRATQGKAQKEMTPEEIEAFIRETKQREERNKVAKKLHFWVFGLFERIKEGKTGPAANESRFVKNGVASVELKIAGDNRSTLEKLTEIGFVMSASQDATILKGTIPIERLGELVEFDAVDLVLPAPFDN